VSIKFKRGVGFIFNLDDELRRIIDILQHAKAGSAERPIKWRGAPNEREDLRRVAQRPRLDL
jgi:hypothetical protein